MTKPEDFAIEDGRRRRLDEDPEIRAHRDRLRKHGEVVAVVMVLDDSLGLEFRGQPSLKLLDRLSEAVDTLRRSLSN